METLNRVGATRLILGILFGFTLHVGAIVAYAQPAAERPNAAVAREAISALRSPYCPGAMLETCSSAAGGLLRDSIYDLAAEGMSSDEIVEWMLARHGEQYRAVPLRTGIGLLAWVIPPLALVLGIGALLLWLRGNRTKAEPKVAATASSTVSDVDREKVAAAMREWNATGEEEV